MFDNILQNHPHLDLYYIKDLSSVYPTMWKIQTLYD